MTLRTDHLRIILASCACYGVMIASVSATPILVNKYHPLGPGSTQAQDNTEELGFMPAGSALLPVGGSNPFHPDGEKKSDPLVLDADIDIDLGSIDLDLTPELALNVPALVPFLLPNLQPTLNELLDIDRNVDLSLFEDCECTRLATVPEPASLLLLGTGMLGTTIFRLRRTR